MEATSAPAITWWAIVAIVLLLLAIIAIVVGTAIGSVRLLRFIERARALKGLCPAPARLQQLVAGQVAPAEQVAINRHVQQCQHCQQVLEALVSPGDSWPDTAKKIGAGRPAPGEALRKVMDSLKRAAHADPIVAGPSEYPGKKPSQPQTRGETGAFAIVPPGLLSPAERPDLLGMLGPYEIQSVIGQGGMGIVLKGFDTALQRVVAIKVLAPHLAASVTARRRFLREAQAVAAVTHDHVVTIHAVDEANGFPYLVMQFVSGQSLQDSIDRKGPLELKEILRIGMQTASGLAAAHAQGLVHRDIKPGNILLENGVQRVKITDFGLARAIDDASLTQSGFIAGSPQFMAPEQARGEAVDHRADLFSLGSVLYTMATGRPPFRADSSLAVLRRVSEETPRPIREINPELPDWLSAIIEKLHAKNPAERFQSAGEVADALGQRLAQLQQVGWEPQAHVPPKTPADRVIPLTSLTICPLCNCRLHVPESKVGQVVNCPECGKPFQVADASSEIQVVQPASFRPSDLRRPQLDRAVGKALAAVGLAACLLFCCFSPVAILGVFFMRTAGEEHAVPATTMSGIAPPRDTSAAKAGNGPERVNIVGTWQAVDGQSDGKPLSPEDVKKTRVIFKGGDSYELQRSGETEEGTYQILGYPISEGLQVYGIQLRRSVLKEGQKARTVIDVVCQPLGGEMMRLAIGKQQAGRDIRNFQSFPGDDRVILTLKRQTIIVRD
jgi:serine/threonine protein kinase